MTASERDLEFRAPHGQDAKDGRARQAVVGEHAAWRAVVASSALRS
jgi:hypothetical protein